MLEANPFKLQHKWYYRCHAGERRGPFADERTALLSLLTHMRDVPGASPFQAGKAWYFKTEDNEMHGPYISEKAATYNLLLATVKP